MIKSRIPTYLKIPMILFHLKIKITPVERYILALIISFNDNLTASNATLSGWFGVGRRTVIDAVKSLELKEMILCERHSGKGRKISLRSGEIIALLQSGLSNAETAPPVVQKSAPSSAEVAPLAVQKSAPSSAEVAPNRKDIGNNIYKYTKDVFVIDPQVFTDYWNAFDSLPKIKAMNKGRIRKLKTRGQEPEFCDNWKTIIRRLASSPFHTGQNDRRWKATVDWILANDTNYMKILDLEDLPDPIDEIMGTHDVSPEEIRELEEAGLL